MKTRVYICGPSAAGKTTFTRLLVAKLEKFNNKKEWNDDVDYEILQREELEANEVEEIAGNLRTVGDDNGRDLLELERLAYRRNQRMFALALANRPYEDNAQVLKKHTHQISVYDRHPLEAMVYTGMMERLLTTLPPNELGDCLRDADKLVRANLTDAEDEERVEKLKRDLFAKEDESTDANIERAEMMTMYAGIIRACKSHITESWRGMSLGPEPSDIYIFLDPSDNFLKQNIMDRFNDKSSRWALESQVGIGGEFLRSDLFRRGLSVRYRELAAQLSQLRKVRVIRIAIDPVFGEENEDEFFAPIVTEIAKTIRLVDPSPSSRWHPRYDAMARLMLWGHDPEKPDCRMFHRPFHYEQRWSTEPIACNP